LIGSSTQRRPGARRATARRRPSRAVLLRRRRSVFALALAVLAIGLVVAAVTGPVEKGIREITLPLRHEDIIRQQARDKDLDPALIAAVIYQESKFQDRTSPAGALGLMQLLPDTAHYIARKSGGTQFTTEDLSTPQINIAYGSWYLRYLIDHYDGEKTLAIAAYNAGETNVDEWVERAGGAHEFDRTEHIPFPETRHYVGSVLERQEQYRERYPRELGIE
jgi:soluble lytic murein transglycosylase